MLVLDIDTLAVFERDFDGFLEFLNGETNRPVISKRFALVFNFDMQGLAVAARAHRNTITRAPQSEGVQRYLRQSIQVVVCAGVLPCEPAQSLPRDQSSWH